MLHGLAERITTGGIPVLRLHYSADPQKCPGSQAGDAWLSHATQGYPGGIQSPRWRKEMELDYGALGGTKLIPNWEYLKAHPKIVTPPFQPHGYRLYGSYDHGWRHKAAYHVHGINGDGKKVTLWEFWDSHVPYTYICKIIKGERVSVPSPGCQCHPNTREFPGNPYAGQEVFKLADQAMWADDQPANDGTMKSMAKLFAKEGVWFQKAERGGDTTFGEWLLTYWQNPDDPGYSITTACPGLIWEIGQQRHKDFSEKVALNRAQPEELVDKDNDAFDSAKYFHLKFPPVPSEQLPAQKPASFAWWRELAQQPAEAGEAVSFVVQTPAVIVNSQRDMVG